MLAPCVVPVEFVIRLEANHITRNHAIRKSMRAEVSAPQAELLSINCRSAVSSQSVSCALAGS